MLPEIKLSDLIVLPTYLIYLSLLYCFLIFYVVHRARNQNQDRKIALDIGLIMMVGGFIGGRLMHVFYEEPGYYQPDWSRIFKFWEGGFVFYGGFIVAALGCWLYARWKKISFFSWADFYAPILALGYGLGRISCFLSGCCYGRACDLPWAVTFSWDLNQVARHPTQLYAVLWELVAFAILIILERRKILARNPGFLFFLWLGLHGLGRLMMEHFRDDFRGAFMAGLSVSSWISWGLLCVAAAGTIRIWRQR
jgi:phosphatidylglycerol:prolipoprotein diacylglycerol transferase